jgi:predicted nucleotidyltransferase component of viral defense system
VASRWFQGQAKVRTFELAELLGTKLRALYQRRKGRDLFDLALALRVHAVPPERVVAAFLRYMKAEGSAVTRADFEANLRAKLRHPGFASDIRPLLRVTEEWDAERDAREILLLLIARLA